MVGGEYVLQPRHVDLTTYKLINRLKSDSKLADDHVNPLATQLLLETTRFVTA